MPVYDYDISSAFPTIARDLVDIRQCQWVFVKGSEAKSLDKGIDIVKGYVKGSVYGYIKCLVTIYDWVMVSPILHRDEDGNLISFTGACEEYLTKGELDFIDKWKIGEYKILEGWWAIAK